MTQYAYLPYSKETQLSRKRSSPSQRQLGAISPNVRKEIRTRSAGVCEVRKRCDGAFAVQMAHITGRKQLTHRTTAADLLDSCVACHRWLDETQEGIQYGVLR